MNTPFDSDTEKRIHCPACIRDFASFKGFKTHLTGNYAYDKENPHYDLRGKYQGISRISTDSPLYDPRT